MDMLQGDIIRFRQIFGTEPLFAVNAPGRVNLIGEHTDYNDGFVLPVAIDRNIFIAAGPRAGRELNVQTLDLQSSAVLSLDNLVVNSVLPWTNYVIGAVKVLEAVGAKIPGGNLCIWGNIPMGAGLSSSAALSVALVMALARLANFKLAAERAARLAQRIETDFVGVHCGIMDQFISIHGRRENALFLDCRTLSFEYVPFPPNLRIVICDTGSRRELASTAYNKRRAECEDSVRQIQGRFSEVNSLRDVTPEQFRAIEKKLSHTAQKRARHVITENVRVIDSVVALRGSDIQSFGRLLTESHNSLRDDYEVSTDDLDAFVKIATETSGVYGARMTGAGFGGSGICIVDKASVDGLVHRLRTEYPRRAGRSLTIYVSTIQDGASYIDPCGINPPVRLTPKGASLN